MKNENFDIKPNVSFHQQKHLSFFFTRQLPMENSFISHIKNNSCKPQTSWNYANNSKINSVVPCLKTSNSGKKVCNISSQTPNVKSSKGNYLDDQKSLSKTGKNVKLYNSKINNVISKKKKKGAYGFCCHCKFYGQPIQWRFAEQEKVCNSCGLHYNKLKNHYKNQPGKANEVFKIQEKMGLGHKRGNHHLELPADYEEIIKKFQKIKGKNVATN